MPPECVLWYLKVLVSLLHKKNLFSPLTPSHSPNFTYYKCWLSFIFTHWGFNIHFPLLLPVCCCSCRFNFFFQVLPSSFIQIEQFFLCFLPLRAPFTARYLLLLCHLTLSRSLALARYSCVSCKATRLPLLELIYSTIGSSHSKCFFGVFFTVCVEN